MLLADRTYSLTSASCCRSRSSASSALFSSGGSGATASEESDGKVMVLEKGDIPVESKGGIVDTDGHLKGGSSLECSRPLKVDLRKAVFA